MEDGDTEVFLMSHYSHKHEVRLPRSMGETEKTERVMREWGDFKASCQRLSVEKRIGHVLIDKYAEDRFSQRQRGGIDGSRRGAALTGESTLSTGISGCGSAAPNLREGAPQILSTTRPSLQNRRRERDNTDVTEVQRQPSHTSIHSIAYSERLQIEDRRSAPVVEELQPDGTWARTPSVGTSQLRDVVTESTGPSLPVAPSLADLCLVFDKDVPTLRDVLTLCSVLMEFDDPSYFEILLLCEDVVKENADKLAPLVDRAIGKFKSYVGGAMDDCVFDDLFESAEALRRFRGHKTHFCVITIGDDDPMVVMFHNKKHLRYLVMAVLAFRFEVEAKTRAPAPSLKILAYPTLADLLMGQDCSAMPLDRMLTLPLDDAFVHRAVCRYRAFFVPLLTHEGVSDRMERDPLYNNQRSFGVSSHGKEMFRVAYRSLEHLYLLEMALLLYKESSVGSAMWEAYGISRN